MDDQIIFDIKKDKILYKEIAKALKEKILNGKFKVGEKIPSEKQLSKILNVSRHTVREGIEELVKEGYLVKKQGSGTYVKFPESEIEKCVIGVFVYKADNQTDSPYLKYITTYLSRKNTLLTIYQISDYPELQSLCKKIVNEKFVKGIISLSIFSEGDRDLIEFLQSHQITVVNIGRRIDTANLDWVICDSAYGSFLITKYLIELGHKKIMFLINEPHTCVIWDRLIGYKFAHQYFGIEIDEDLIIDCNTKFFENSKEKAYLKIKEIIKRRKALPDAIFCVSDAGAIGVIKGLEEIGYKVPDDISVCGFDDISSAELFNLTTIRNPYEEMSKKAVEIILNNIEKKIFIPENPLKIILKPEIIIRNSVKERRG
ncbi:MAG: GntR family transcriptional regulator [Candidatus Omnitrophica bacterium]|nr:GntR family transcriptional regulator [Candidatus Omnitrophota bacterium]